MAAILISWVVMFFVLFSLGNIFINIYNKICKAKENYGFLDTFILGMCFILIPLQFTSLWLPSNQYITLSFVILCIIYWCYNRVRLKEYIFKIKSGYNSISILQKILIALSLISVIAYLLFLSDFFDSDFYHYQNIRWNEEYAVVPGLGNLEDRFGFNSNYLLLCAVFSFRFLFGEAIYTFQGLLYILLLGWGFMQLIKSQFKIEYIILMIFLMIIFITSETLLDNSSTDVIPMLCIFYYIIKTVLSPNWLTKRPLLAFILPVALVTFKLSTAIFCLICFVILLQIINKKQYKAAIFIFSASFLIVLLWCIRNIIITGYLVYPLYEIDLFSFDWKMPSSVLALQRVHIYNFADFMFKKWIDFDVFIFELHTNKILALGRLLNWLSNILILSSGITVIYSIIKKKKISSCIYYIYIICIIGIIFNMASAPDFRFMYGYIWGGAFLHIFIFLHIIKKQSFVFKNGNIILLLFALFMGYASFKMRLLLVSYIYEKDKNKLKTIIYTPLPHPRSYESEKKFDTYKMGPFDIFVTVDENGRTFDKLPATNPTGLPFTPFDGNKIQNIKTVENRGNSLQDGFRTKKEYIGLLNENSEKYIQEYESIFNKKYYGE